VERFNPQDGVLPVISLEGRQIEGVITIGAILKLVQKSSA
jgi:hypothetical protein